jgi:membrane fusion protein, multidrug efflux system
MQKSTSDDGPGLGAGAAGTAIAPKRKLRLEFLARPKFVRNAAIALIGPLAAITAGLWLYATGGRYISTDNAYVKADKVAVSTDISGRVVKVAVVADQRVEQGALLFQLDPEPHRIALAKAEAQLAAAVRDAEAAKALYGQRTARLKQAEGDVGFHSQAHDRQKQLSKKGVVSQSGMDIAERNLRNGRDQILIIEQEIAEMRAKLGGSPEAPVESYPSVREAQALRDQAALDLARTEVKAAVGGFVTNFDLKPGEHVTAGRTVFSVVAAEEIWIQANFKETELTHVKPGQTATVHIDTYPDADRRGVVTSISSATGSEFAVLPPQNATGNWVKVVQRLPVRLKLEPTPGAPPLRAGMSVVVTIDTEQQRGLPRWAKSLFGSAKAKPQTPPRASP